MQKKLSAEEVISYLNLSLLQEEGGWFRRSWESKVQIPGKTLPSCYKNKSHASGSAIYYLITKDQFSAFHKLSSDEIFHFYYGDPVSLHRITPEGKLVTELIGTDFAQKQAPQRVIPANNWQALCCHKKQYGFSLLGCTVSPEFQWQNFELGDREKLTQNYPTLEETITRFTR